jgi:bifunctional DNA-binding transcriptional regulator/antitoxin component of YhaV-PrlF toxin-antitoxin module
MTITLKPKTEIAVPKSIRRQAGIKPGDRLQSSASGRAIDSSPKLSLDEQDDEREMRAPKIRAVVRASHAEFIAGKGRPATEFFSDRAARAKGRA